MSGPDVFPAPDPGQPPRTPPRPGVEPEPDVPEPPDDDLGDLVRPVET